jgi:lysyl-tRNA synthetase class 2
MITDSNILKRRHAFMRALRALFDDQDFTEVETPYLLQANTPDPHIDPIFASTHFPLAQSWQLHTSPEIWLKKALNLGMAKIYEIARVFRDDPPGRFHSKEFTMIEWYRTQADLIDMLDDCRKIFDLAHQEAQDFKPLVFKEYSTQDLFAEHAHIDLQAVLNEVKSGNHLKLNQILKDRGDLLPDHSTLNDAFFLVMIKYIEPRLPPEQATVISRWPVQLAALAAPCADNDLFCDRFEIYYQGLEIANAYQECLDAKVLEERFLQENDQRKSMQKPVFAIDYAFLNALAGQPKTAGIALGIDRLLMAAWQKSCLQDLIFGSKSAKKI